MTPPLVSVITPYYSQPEFLLDAVRSVEAQTYARVEMIVVDDGSPEPRAESLLGWRKPYGLTIITTGANEGKAAARNTAVAHARGEIILPLDADDMIEPDYIEKTVAVLESERCDAVYTDVRIFGSADFIWQPDCSLPACLSYGVPTTFVYRRQVHDRLGGYRQDLRYGADRDFWIRALEGGIKVSAVREPLYNYRAHAAGETSRTDYGERLVRDILVYHRGLHLKYLEDVIAGGAQRCQGRSRDLRGLKRRYGELVELSASYPVLQ